MGLFYCLNSQQVKNTKVSSTLFYHGNSMFSSCYKSLPILVTSEEELKRCFSQEVNLLLLVVCTVQNDIDTYEQEITAQNLNPTL